MGIVLKVNGKEGQDWLLASVGGRRFPSRVEVTNTGAETVEVELRMRPGSEAQVRIADQRLRIEPGATTATRILAETPGVKEGDTVLEVLMGGEVAAEFRFTVASLARESVYHNLVPRFRGEA